MPQVSDVNTQLLIEAREKFFSTVSGSDLELFSKCSSHAEFLEDIRKLEIISQQKRRGTKFLGQIEKLSKGLEQYFNVIGIMISSSSEFVAIGWGVFRLVLQLASGFVTFFEKLTKIIALIADALPQYQDILRIFRESPSDRVKSSLSQVYGDFFEFFEGVTRVFTKENGKIKRSPAVIGSLFWKPFDVRFKDLLDRLAYHKSLLETEISIHMHLESHGLKAAQLEEHQKAEDARQAANISNSVCWDIRQSQKSKDFEQTVARIRNWLAPPEFLQEYEQAQALMEYDTATWLFDDPKFVEWRSLEGPSGSETIGYHFNRKVLWVKGNPGCGKTVLASSTISELRSLESSDGLYRPTTCFFFFSQISPTKSSFIGALRAILAQILHQFQSDSDFISKLSFAMSEVTGGQITASQMELVELIDLCLMSLPNISIVLDAIDECDDSETLIKTIKRLCTRSDTKFLLFSRPNVSGLRQAIQEQCCVEMDNETNHSDLKLYFERRLYILMDDGLLPSSCIIEHFVHRLLRGAHGMFLWGRLMVSYLNSPALTPAQRVSTITDVNLPEGLSTMYERILGLIMKQDKAQQEIARRVFIWLAHGRRELTYNELQAALLAGAKIATDSTHVDFGHTVVMSCGGLVEIPKLEDSNINPRAEFRPHRNYSILDSKPSSTFKFIHLSVLEFFSVYAQTTPSHLNSLHKLISTQPQAHIEMLKASMFYLTYQTQAGPLSGSPTIRSNYAILSRTFPFLSYATHNWIQHLFETIPTYAERSKTNSSQQTFSDEQWVDVIECLTKFFTNKKTAMAWLEAYYTFPDIRLLEHEKLSQWCAWAKDSLVKSVYADFGERCCQNLEEFANVLMKINTEWHSILSEKPCEVWGQLADFVSTKFLEGSQSTLIDSIAPKSPNLKKLNLCKSPLSTMSETRTNGIETAVLSIWTSQEFEDIQKTLTPSDSYLKLQEVCAGWVARYEIWTVSGNKSSMLHSMSIDIDEAEVWLQIRQSMRQDILNTWKIQFPIDISDDLRTFSLLRTIFKISVDSDQNAKFDAIILPMRIHSEIPNHWSDEKLGFGPCLARHIPVNLQLGSHELHEYKVKLGPNGHFVAIHEASFCQAGRISVFKVDRIGGKYTTIFESSIHSQKNDQLTFHPLLPLLAIKSSVEILIWTFLSECKKIAYFTSNSHSKARFSECGKYLVFNSPNERPSIYSLENHDAYKAAITHYDIQETKHLEASVSVDSPDQSLLSTILNSKEGKLMRHDAISVKGNSGSEKLLMIDQADFTNGIELRRYHANIKNATESLHLSTLPKWEDVETANIVVSMPQKKGDSLKIILNKSSDKWSYMERTQNQNFPAIIQRDPQSIDPALAPSINLSRQRLNEDGGTRLGDAMMLGDSGSNGKSISSNGTLDQKSSVYKSSDPSGFQIRPDRNKRKFEE